MSAIQAAKPAHSHQQAPENIANLSFLSWPELGLSGCVSRTVFGQNDGVNPSVETIWDSDTCRSMDFPTQTVPLSESSSAGEAEASSPKEHYALVSTGTI